MLGFGFFLTAAFYFHPPPEKRQQCWRCRLRRVEREGGEVWPESSRLLLHLCSGSPSQSAHLHNLLLRSLSALLSYRLLSFLLIVPSFVLLQAGRKGHVSVCKQGSVGGFSTFYVFVEAAFCCWWGSAEASGESGQSRRGQGQKQCHLKTFCCFNRLCIEPFVY